MKKIVLFNFLLIISSALFSQETTLGKSNEENTTGAVRNKKVLLIPFDAKMYRSDADRDIAMESKMAIDQVRSSLRSAMNKYFIQGALSDYSVQSLLDNDPEIRKDLDYAYNSIGYKYELLPADPMKAEAKSPLKNIFAGKETAPAPTGAIRNGQVQTTPDKSERYMKTQIINPGILSHLNEKYGAEILVFINEFDIVISPVTNQEAIMNNSYNRQVKAHYTVMDYKGNVLSSGASFAEFSSKNNNIHQVVRSVMPQITQQILGSIKEKTN